MRISKAVRVAKQLILNNNVIKAPVDVRAIAERFAIVVEKRMPDNLSGMLVPTPGADDGRRHTIVVNKDHAETRQRFTIAHELGHLLLHDYRRPHADAVFKVRLRANVNYDDSIKEEIEANHFAAELLMPTDLVVAGVEKVGIDMNFDDSDTEIDVEIEKLAKKFRVSKQAMKIRVNGMI